MKLKISHKKLAERKPTKRKSAPADKGEGILYVLVIKLEDTTLVKVGVTCRKRVEDRTCEVLTSIWKKYRVFPECVVKRFARVPAVYEKEKIMHDRLSADRYKTKYLFSGSTEFFSTSITDVIEIYDEVTGRLC